MRIAGPAAFICLAAATTAAGDPGAAQARPPEPSVENVYRITDCLLRRRDRNIEQVLSTVPGAQDSNVPWVLAAIGPCLIPRRPIPPGSYYPRGAVAERLLYRDFEAIGVVRGRRRPVTVFPPVPASYLAAPEQYSRNYLFLLDTAACVVRAQPARIFAFFRTGRDSPEERSAIAELVPSISACTFEGQTLELTPAIFRAVLAEAAYRVSAGQPNVFEVTQ